MVLGLGIVAIWARNGEGCWATPFKYPKFHVAGIAQLVMRSLIYLEVWGSNPAKNFFKITSTYQNVKTSNTPNFM
jgi:hypothetical protein